MKNHIGIYFASKHGQTQKIANYIGQLFRLERAEVEIVDLGRSSESLPSVLGFDTVLIGSPVYQQRYPREVVRFVRENRDKLRHVPSTGFFSVSLAATPQNAEAYAESLGPVRRFLDDVAWSPQWIASFPRALNYLEYNPFLRWIMKKISAKEHGPTDTRHDYYLTRWNEVAQFAMDFYNDAPNSRYRERMAPRATRTLNALMPTFEQRIVQRETIKATADEVRAAIETMELEDMPLANLLAWARNLGQKTPRYSPHVSFHDSAEAFGTLTIESGERREILGALVGQFWKRDYGIRRMHGVNEFRNFGRMDYTKVLTNFWFDDSTQGKTVVRTETRIHSMSYEAERHFRLYWLAVSLGVRLYMRSVLHGIRRSLQHRRWEHRVVAA